MSPYQNQSGNAIFHRQSIRYAHLFLRQRSKPLLLLLLTLILYSVLEQPQRAIATTSLLHHYPYASISMHRWEPFKQQSASRLSAESELVKAAPLLVKEADTLRRRLNQNQQGSIILPPMITPLESTTAELLTHTADMRLIVNESATGDQALTLQVDARYRLENSAKTPLTLILKVSEPAQETLLTDISLAIAARPLTIFRTEGVGYTAQLQLGADSRTIITLRTTVTLPQSALPRLVYSLPALKSWRGNPSIRVSIGMNREMTAESWLAVTPDTWRYTQITDDTHPGIKWLYDGYTPDTPIIFEFIHPLLWQRLQQLSNDATYDTTTSDTSASLELGHQYRALLDAVPMTGTYTSVRNRFYAQALAAYTTGIQQLNAVNGSPTELGTLYAALASLYRTQVARPNGTTDTVYANMMVETAQQALTQLPPDASQRRELIQWMADGFQITLSDAQQREDWPTALQAIDALTALPSGLVDGGILEQTRQAITVRQALQLLEEGNRSTAMTVAGEALRDPSLLPPSTSTTIFHHWEISATISPQTVLLDLQPVVADSRQNEAVASITQLVQQLQSAVMEPIAVEWRPFPIVETTSADETALVDTQPIGRLLIRAPNDTSFASLTTAMPALPEWSLLYTLLRQLQPRTNETAGWLNRQTEVTLPLDLRAVGEEWETIASNLEAQATEWEREAAGLNRRDAAAAERALQLRIRATNYRTAAQEWRTVRRDSHVLIRLEIPAAFQPTLRTTLLTVASAPQVLTIQSSPSYFSSFISVVILSILGVLVLSGFFWWLL